MSAAKVEFGRICGGSQIFDLGYPNCFKKLLKCSRLTHTFASV